MTPLFIVFIHKHASICTFAKVIPSSSTARKLVYFPTLPGFKQDTLRSFNDWGFNFSGTIETSKIQVGMRKIRNFSTRVKKITFF